ncbi:hypothetical protein CTEN210_13597 [Chaetoceros tenuissimus]|uniref:Ubiquitin-like protease family profile domain-containing protein n=1 Tax=Chaetoceros tenuissimus TaxID=426638 RepID=A0AAD3HBD7_9STRA|nr:hypothetical protein CTEN210_13597 [Chaetoceros tenuissimus]
MSDTTGIDAFFAAMDADQEPAIQSVDANVDISGMPGLGPPEDDDTSSSEDETGGEDSDGDRGSEDSDSDDSNQEEDDFFEEEIEEEAEEEEEEDDEEEEEEEATATTPTTAEQSNSLYYDPNDEGMNVEIEESAILQMDQDLEELKDMSFKKPFDAQFIADSERILRNVDNVTSKFPQKSFQLGDVADKASIDLDSITVMTKHFKDVFKLFNTDKNYFGWQMSPMIVLRSMSSSRVRVGVKKRTERRLGRSTNTRSFPNVLLGKLDILHEEEETFKFDAWVYLVLVRPEHFGNSPPIPWGSIIPKELIQCIMIVLNLSRAFIKGQIPITIDGRIRNFPNTTQGNKCSRMLERIKTVIEKFQTNKHAAANIKSIFDTQILRFDYKMPNPKDDIKKKGSFKDFKPQSGQIMMTLFDLILELLSMNAFGLEMGPEGSRKHCLRNHLEGLFAVCTDDGSRESARLGKKIKGSNLDRFSKTAAFNEYLLKNKNGLSKYCTFLKKHSFFQVVAAGTKSMNPCFEVPLDGHVTQLQTKYDGTIQTFRSFLTALFHKETLKSKHVSLILDVGFNFSPKPAFKAFVIAPRLQYKGKKNKRLGIQNKLRASDTEGQFSALFQNDQDNSTSRNDDDETATSDENSIDHNNESGQSSKSSTKFCAILSRSPEKKVFFNGINVYQQYPLLLSSHAYSQHTSGTPFRLEKGCLVGNELNRSRKYLLYGNVVGINSYIQGLRKISRCESFDEEKHNFEDLPSHMSQILKWNGFNSLHKSEMELFDRYLKLLRRTKYFQTPHANIFTDKGEESLACRYELFVDASQGIDEILKLDILKVLGTEVALMAKADIALRYFASLEKCRQMILHCFTEPNSSKRVNLRNAVAALDGYAKSNLLYAADLLAHCHPSSSITCETVSENMEHFRHNLFKSKPHLPIHMPLSNIEPQSSKTVTCIAEDGSTIDVYCANLKDFTAAPVLSQDLKNLIKDFESNDEQNISEVENDRSLMINLANEYQRLYNEKCAALHHDYRKKKSHAHMRYVKMQALSELIDCIDNFEKIENVKRYVCALFWACYRLQIQEDLYANGYGNSSAGMTSHRLGPMSEEALKGILGRFNHCNKRISTIGDFIEHLFRRNHKALTDRKLKEKTGSWHQCTYLICFEILIRKIETNPGIMYSAEEIESGFLPTELLEHSLLESFLQYKYKFLHFSNRAKRSTIPKQNSNNTSLATIVVLNYHNLENYVKKPLNARANSRSSSGARSLNAQANIRSSSDVRSPAQRSKIKQRIFKWNKPDSNLNFFGESIGQTRSHEEVKVHSKCAFIIVFCIFKEAFNYSDESWKEIFADFADSRSNIKFPLVDAFHDIFQNRIDPKDFISPDERISIADSHKLKTIADSGLLNLYDRKKMKRTLQNPWKRPEDEEKFLKKFELRISFIERFRIEEGGKFSLQLVENVDSSWVTIGGAMLNKFFRQKRDKNFVDFYENNKELYKDILEQPLVEQATSLDIQRKWWKILGFIIEKGKGFHCIEINERNSFVRPSDINRNSEMFELAPATLTLLKGHRSDIHKHIREQNKNSTEEPFADLIAHTCIAMRSLCIESPKQNNHILNNWLTAEEKNTTHIITCYQNKYPTECSNIFKISSSVDGNHRHHLLIAETENNGTGDISMEGETGTASDAIGNFSNNDVEMDDAVVLDESSGIMEVEAEIGEDAHMGEAAVTEEEATTMSNAINDENDNDFSLDERYTPESLEALMKCKAIITPDSDEESMTDQGLEFDKDLLAQYKEVTCVSRLKLQTFLSSECDDSDEDSFPSDDEDDHTVRFIKEFEPTLDQKRSQFEEIMNKTELNDSEVGKVTDSFGSVKKPHPYVESKALDTLQPGKWLSSDIINYFYEYIQFLDRMDKQETLIFDSSFYQQLLGTNPQRFRNLERLCINSNISKYKYVLIPCNLNENHWILTRFIMEKRIIEFYDSFNEKHEDLFLELKKLMKSVTGHDFNFQYERVIPQQSNFVDCGIYTCLYGYYLHLGKDIDFTQECFDLTRQKIVLLITSRIHCP